MQAGALKVLCEHAHSTNPRLRLNAVWALKHLVASAENAVKVSCLEELGQDWLIRMIGGGEGQKKNKKSITTRPDEDTPMEGTGAPLPEADYPPLDSPLDWDEEGNVNMMTDDYGLKMPSSSSPRDSSEATQSEPTHPDPESAVIEDAMEQEVEGEGDVHPEKISLPSSSSPPKAHQADMLAVQEQGLSLIRNIITGPKSDEMIDYLLDYFGPERFYGILASKLRVRCGVDSNQPVNHNDNDSAHTSTTGTIPLTDKLLDGPIDPYVVSEPEIITGVCFILVHIAASHARHRQGLIQQTWLLRSLVPFCRHSSRQVRTAWAWVIINLTWVDEPGDRSMCRFRAAELRRLGFMEGLEKIVRDPELDVKEQSRTALWQLRDLM